ncbi:MAG: PAS domain S-box protein [Planctomycetes bacterium]|nr:PAS domain S-box protein [Planctomycetota bacterium]
MPFRRRGELRFWVRRCVEISAVALVYYAAALLGITLAFGDAPAPLVWSPDGAGLAAILLLGVVLLLTVTAVVTAALLRDNREEVIDLRRARGELEERVQERTLQLAVTNAALEGRIAEQERSGRDLRESHRALEEYVDSMSTLSAKVAQDGTLLLVNRAAQRASGLPYSELMQVKLLDAPWWGGDPAVRERVRGAFERAVSGFPVAYDETLRSGGGRVLTIDFSLVPVFGEDAAVRYVLVEARDITAQKNAETKFRGILESAPDAMVIVDSSGRIEIVNGQTERVFRYARGDLIGQPVEILVPERYREGHHEHCMSFFGDPAAIRMGAGRELYGRRSDGSEFPIEIGLSPIATGRGVYACASIRDISERKAADERLRESEARYRLLADHSTDLITRNSTGGVILYASPSVSSVLGYDPGEFVGHSYADYLHPDDLPALRIAHARLLHLKEDVTTTSRVRRRDGAYVWMESKTRAILHPDTGAVRELLATSRDVTDRRLAEEERDRAAAQLLQGQKLQAIGQLSAGIAHELNNPTGFILSNLTTLSDYFTRLSRLLQASDEAAARLARGESAEVVRTDLDRLRQELDAEFILTDFNQAVRDCVEGGKRIRDIVLSLRAFSHADEGERRLTDLNECLESTIRLCWNEIKYKAAVRRDGSRLPPVYGYPQRLNQVFVNLLVNAAQAIRERGEITISTRAEDGQAVVRICDNGEGISPDLLPRVFEPFFTTKPVGRGTGLGLHLAHKIVEAHGGGIEIRSEVGRGTEVTVRLPAAPENEAARVRNDTPGRPEARTEVQP